MLWNYGQRPYFHKRNSILQILIRPMPQECYLGA